MSGPGIEVEARGIECQINAFPRSECGDLRNRFERTAYPAHQIIPTHVHSLSPIHS